MVASDVAADKLARMWWHHDKLCTDYSAKAFEQQTKREYYSGVSDEHRMIRNVMLDVARQLEVVEEFWDVLDDLQRREDFHGMQGAA